MLDSAAVPTSRRLPTFHAVCQGPGHRRNPRSVVKTCARSQGSQEMLTPLQSDDSNRQKRCRDWRPFLVNRGPAKSRPIGSPTQEGQWFMSRIVHRHPPSYCSWGSCLKALPQCRWDAGGGSKTSYSGRDRCKMPASSRPDILCRSRRPQTGRRPSLVRGHPVACHPHGTSRHAGKRRPPSLQGLEKLQELSSRLRVG